MRRREYLHGSALFVAALGGCTGDSDRRAAMRSPTDEPRREQETRAGTATETDTSTTQTGTAGGGPAVEVGEGELVVDDAGFITDVYVEVTAENVGGDHSGTVEVTVEWYNEAGEYMDNSSAFLNSLGPDEVWAARVYYLGTAGEEVSDYEVAGEFSMDSPDMNPDGLELLESELQVGDDEAVVSGRVANERKEPASYVEATAKIYDADGVVLDDEWTNVSDVPPGEVWTFDVSWFGRDRVADAADHAVWITDSPF